MIPKKMLIKDGIRFRPKLYYVKELGTFEAYKQWRTSTNKFLNELIEYLHKQLIRKGRASTFMQIPDLRHPYYPDGYCVSKYDFKASGDGMTPYSYNGYNNLGLEQFLGAGVSPKKTERKIFGDDEHKLKKANIIPKDIIYNYGYKLPKYKLDYKLYLSKEEAKTYRFDDVYYYTGIDFTHICPYPYYYDPSSSYGKTFLEKMFILIMNGDKKIDEREKVFILSGKEVVDESESKIYPGNLVPDTNSENGGFKIARYNGVYKHFIYNHLIALPIYDENGIFIPYTISDFKMPDKNVFKGWRVWCREFLRLNPFIKALPNVHYEQIYYSVFEEGLGSINYSDYKEHYFTDFLTSYNRYYRTYHHFKHFHPIYFNKSYDSLIFMEPYLIIGDSIYPLYNPISHNPYGNREAWLTLWQTFYDIDIEFRLKWWEKVLQFVAPFLEIASFISCVYSMGTLGGFMFLITKIAEENGIDLGIVMDIATIVVGDPISKVASIVNLGVRVYSASQGGNFFENLFKADKGFDFGDNEQPTEEKSNPDYYNLGQYTDDTPFASFDYNDVFDPALELIDESGYFNHSWYENICKV